MSHRAFFLGFVTSEKYEKLARALKRERKKLVSWENTNGYHSKERVTKGKRRLASAELLQVSSCEPKEMGKLRSPHQWLQTSLPTKFRGFVS